MAETLLPHTRLGKPRAKLPEEYYLAQFLSDVDNTHPSWNTDTPVCEWDRVECDARGEIRRIDWSALSLSGIPGWMHLENVKCRSLSISDNRLRDEIVLEWLPPNIRFFIGSGNTFGGFLRLESMPEQLETLQLDRCSLHGTISLHSLPPVFRSLQVGHNQLSGSLDFGALPLTIKGFILSDNNFSGPVDFRILPQNIFLCVYNNPNLWGEFDPTWFERDIDIHGTKIRKLPSRGSYASFLPLRYVFDSDVWNF